MHITVVAVLCHMLPSVPTAPVCREEIVTEGDMSMQACMVSQPALADWKSRSAYHGEAWTISRYKCVPGGGYVIRDAI